MKVKYINGLLGLYHYPGKTCENNAKWTKMEPVCHVGMITNHTKLHATNLDELFAYRSYESWYRMCGVSPTSSHTPS